jgi:hypothetical protein
MSDLPGAESRLEVFFLTLFFNSFAEELPVLPRPDDRLRSERELIDSVGKPSGCGRLFIFEENMSHTRSAEGRPALEPRRQVPRASRRAEAIDRLIRVFEKTLESKNVTVADFIRLLQLEKEIGGEEAKDIRVAWIEKSEPAASSEG